jgi:HAD superfamily hydrolase (TIGR01509 family)
MPLRAIIFDFNGVIADDETPHLLMFQQALREEGLSLTKEDYYGMYLGMDERNCLAMLIQKARGRRDPTCEQRVHDRKVALFRDYTAAHPPELFPGAADFVKQVTGRYRLAITSGGTREQIASALRGASIEKDFAVIVAAEDTTIGKPDPAIYRLTLQRLNETAPPPRPPLRTADCLVIEDSLAGIQSAKAAGMTVLGVATTYPAAALREADAVFPGLQAVAFTAIEKLFARDGG